MDKRSDVEDFQHPLRSNLLALPVRERLQTTYYGMVKALPIMLGMASGEPITERLQTTQHGMVKLLGHASSHIMGKGETIP
jgi:hypothetical protein